jgi:hypothetical protein
MTRPVASTKEIFGIFCNFGFSPHTALGVQIARKGFADIFDNLLLLAILFLQFMAAALPPYSSAKLVGNLFSL